MPSHARAVAEAETAELLIALLKADQAVVSEHQVLINDASKRKRGFTDEFVDHEIIEQFKAKT
jgi:hypothetical protein